MKHESFLLQIISSSEGSFMGLVPAIFCSNFTRYIDVNDTLENAQELGEKLCNLTQSGKIFEASTVFLTELDLERLVPLVSDSRKELFHRYLKE